MKKSLGLKIGFCLQNIHIPPVLKQTFVTVGVTLNLASIGLVFGFAVPLLGQLKVPGSTIPIDDEEGSWIASLPAFFTFVGTIFVVPLMGKYGRRAANLVSITILIVSWTGITLAPNIVVLLVARFLQGINLGMSTTLGSLLIGEYTSPRNRGAFLTTISVTIATGVLSAHILAFTTWRIGALICAVVTLVDLVIVILSPESPSWLASQGRYDESRQVFRWLRGDSEEEELNNMIEACIFTRTLKVKVDESESFPAKVQKKLSHFKATAMKKEFYIPLIIAGHIYSFCVWSGVNILIAYPLDYINKICGSDINVSLVTTSIDIQRIISSITATYIIKKIRRRTIILVTVVLNVLALIMIAVYAYVKDNYVLPFDHPMIGIVLSHFMMFAIAAGTSPMPFIIVGEIFPLEHKTLAGGIGSLMFSFHLFVVTKTIPFCFKHLGVHGTLCLDAVVMSYCMLVVWFLLPETKDKRLQDIEEEFRRKVPCKELEPDTKSPRISGD